MDAEGDRFETQTRTAPLSVAAPKQYSPGFGLGVLEIPTAAENPVLDLSLVMQGRGAETGERERALTGKGSRRRVLRRMQFALDVDVQEDRCLD